MLATVLGLALLALVGLGCWVLAAAPDAPANRAFAAYAGLAALWVLNDVTGLVLGGPVDRWARGAFLLALAMQVALLRFARTFPAPRPAPPGEAALVAVVVTALGLVSLLGEPLARVARVDGRLEVELNGWTLLLGLACYGCFARAVGLLLAARRQATDARVRRQIELVALADLGTSAAATVTSVALPLLGAPWAVVGGSLALLAGGLVHAWAMLALRLLRPDDALADRRVVPLAGELTLAVLVAWAAAVTLAVGAAGAALRAPLTGLAAAWTAGAAAAALPVVALLLVVHERVGRPLRALAQTADAVGRGERVRAAVPAGRDEVTLLARELNLMIDRLERDAEAQRALAARLVHAERLAVAGTLAAGVAHEVNNPLAAVSSLVQLARERTTAPADRALLDDALAQVDRVARALRDLLDVARARPPARAPVDLNAVVRDVARLVGHDARSRGLDLELDLAPDLPPVEGDAGALQQVVLNLLLNARDAVEGRPRRRVEVTTRAPTPPGGGRPPAVVLAVRDDGPGLDPAVRGRLFEPFVTTKGADRGTGLGLAVCRDLVRAHGGRLALDDAQGGGCVAQVELPPVGADALGSARLAVALAETTGGATDPAGLGGGGAA